MKFKVGDKVVFHKGSSWIQAKVFSDREYTLLEKREDEVGRTFFIIKNDFDEDEFIYEVSIKNSPRYIRNKTIDDILK